MTTHSAAQAAPVPAPAWIHPTAIVEAGAQLRPGVKVWHHCHVRAGARLGLGAQLGQGCYVAPTVVIGANCKIQNHVSLYDGVTLEDDVFVGPCAVFTNVKTPRAHISRKHAYLSTRIARGATIGANATVVCGVQIGRYAMIGAGAVVTHDVPPFALMIGTPARHVGWSCQCGARLPSPILEREGAARCDDCGSNYVFMRDSHTLRWLEEEEQQG